jgi:hypothetical protein
VREGIRPLLPITVFHLLLHFFWRLILLQLDENASGPVLFPTQREIVFSAIQSFWDNISPTDAVLLMRIGTAGDFAACDRV